MMANNNGFADALKDINTLIKVDKQVELDVLEQAANYFVNKLKPHIPRTNRNKKHLIDNLKVVVKGDRVSVEFGDAAWYWFLAEHGHKKTGGRGRVKGQHFVRNTFDHEGDKITEIMANKIIKKMGG
jgi:HK97 gp10 family phage protein